MATAARTQLLTFTDFCVLTGDRKADLIDGVIYMASPDNTEGNDLFGWLFSIMKFFVAARDLGKLYGSRVAFRLDDANGPEPDIAFVRKDRLHLVHRGFVQGPADLAVEIVSPESVDRDYIKKRRQYERAGFTEYWILDPLEQKVTLLRLSARGKYREVRPRRGELHSEALPGFWLRPEWLWQDPLPNPASIFAEVLSRSE
ncbi:MAG TPA: Uma2 family endonuclease [Gemmataceae bacterium]|nr:Uma2 family endonuclease [Gemmataceae bacterium]